MVYAFAVLAVLFVAVGFIVTPTNAAYILSGYNTMSEEERQKVDLKSFMAYFKKFHIVLGISFLLLGYAINLINKNAAGLFLMMYPMLAYLYFTLTSSEYMGGLKTRSNKIGIAILAGALVCIAGLIGFGFMPNKIIYDSHNIELTGSYGETLKLQHVKTIELVQALPKLTVKTNGFALGHIKKGHFKTEDGEIVKLLINDQNGPFLLITKADRRKIYYSTEEESIEAICSDIKKLLNNRKHASSPNS